MGTHWMILLTIGNLIPSSSSLFAGLVGGGLGPPPPNEKTCLRQAATVTAILWKVEFATS